VLEKRCKFKFTMAQLEKIEAPGSGFILVRDTAERSLEARVTAGGNIILYSRHFLDGKDYRLSLGRLGEISIEEARRKAEEYRVSFRKGIDPRDLERKPRDSITFGHAFKEFMERYSKREKRSWKHDEREINKHVGRWFNRPINKITKQDIIELFNHIGDCSGRTQANHVLERIRAIYNKMIFWGWEGSNPTFGIKKFRMKKRMRFLSGEELGMLGNAMEKFLNQTLVDIVKIALFTGARKGNVLSMRWHDINWDLEVWNIPMTKNGDPLTVPLCRGQWRF
jgi:integrase